MNCSIAGNNQHLYSIDFINCKKYMLLLCCYLYVVTMLLLVFVYFFYNKFSSNDRDSRFNWAGETATPS